MPTVTTNLQPEIITPVSNTTPPVSAPQVNPEGTPTGMVGGQQMYSVDTSKPVTNPAGGSSVVPTTPPLTETTTTKVDTTPTGTVTTQIKPTAPVADFNSSAGRQSEITQHLMEGATQNPNLLQNREAFNQAYNYSTADAGKKALMDSFFTSHNQNTSTGILNTLMNGGTVDPSTRGTPDYAEANKNFSLISQFGTSNGKQLYDAVNGGLLTEGTPAWNIIAQKAPQAYQEYAKIKQQEYAKNKINGQSQIFGKVLSEGSKYDSSKSMASQVVTPEKVEPPLQSLSDKITANLTEQQAINLKNNIMLDPNIKSGSEELVKLNQDLQDLKNQEAALITNTRKSLIGTGATDDYLMAKVRVESEPLYLKMNQLTNNINAKSQLLQMYTQSYQKDIENQMKSKEIELQGLQYEDQKKTQMDMFNLQQAYAHPDINSDNPQVARIAANDLVNKYLDIALKGGVQVNRSSAQILQDAQQLAKTNGITLGEALQSSFVDPLQTKPEWQSMMSSIQNTGKEWGVIGQKADEYGNNVAQYGWIDKKTGTITPYNTGTSTQTTGGKDLTAIIDAKKGNDTNIGVWTNNPGNIMGDTQAQKDMALGMGAIGFYNSKNGRTYAVFGTKADGLNAMSNDIDNKLSGGSSWANENTTLADFAKGWTNGPRGAANPTATANMIKFLNSNGLNVNANTKIGSLGSLNLAQAVQYNEGTLNKPGQDWTNTGTTGLEPTPAEEAFYNQGSAGIGKGKLTQQRYNEIGQYKASQPPESENPLDATSNSILAQTGIDATLFNYLTIGQTALARMPAAQQAEVKKKATEFLNKNNLDYSTFKSRYSALTDSLERTTKIMANVQRDENEIQGTLDNVMSTADDSEFKAMKKVNILKLLAGEEFNDPNVLKYQFQLSLLQEEIAGYYAALRGDTSPVEADSKKAAQIIASGVSSGGLKGLKDGMEEMVLKMGKQLPKSVDNINKQVWDLFGVGDKFKGTQKPNQESSDLFDKYY